MLRRLLSVLAAGALLSAAAALLVPSASAASVPEATSANWAGYVASAGGSDDFSRVSGSWVQPSVDASAGDGYSAFWVGLGGSGQSQSGALEQVGTQADVVGGRTVYYAWYELLPAAPVQLSVAIHPGDHISASVSVSGDSVTMSLSDQTTGASYSNTLQASNTDTSSAEWVAEAPSASDGQGGLQPLALADFGKVGFTNATATAGSHTGSISDPSWSAEAVQLDGSQASAQPSALSSDGSSFSDSWESAGGAGSSSAGVSGPGGQYGYGGGYGGYGDGGYGDGGYGDGYGGNGYGSYGYGGYGPAGYVYGY